MGASSVPKLTQIAKYRAFEETVDSLIDFDDPSTFQVTKQAIRVELPSIYILGHIMIADIQFQV